MQINIDVSKIEPSTVWFIRRWAWNVLKAMFFVGVAVGWIFAFAMCVKSESALLIVGYIAITMSIVIGLINTFHDRFLRKLHGRG